MVMTTAGARAVHSGDDDGRLEHLRGSALGFRNLTNYVTLCLLETGGFRDQLHPRLGSPP